MTAEIHSQSAFKARKHDFVMQDYRLKFEKGKQKEFLETVIKEQFGSQAGLGSFLGCGKRTVCGWRTEKNNIPKSVFQKLIESYPQYKKFEQFIEKELPWNWGWIKGGKARVSQNRDLHGYLKYVRSFVSHRIRKKPVLTDVENLLLGQLSAEDVDLLSILAVCTLTDGSLVKSYNTYRINFSSSDEVLIDFAYALFGKLSGFCPNIHSGSKGGKIVAITDRGLGRKLLNLSPEYRTFPLNEKNQPSISFLSDKTFQTKVWAIRFAFTLDGCISLPKSGKAELSLACFNRSTCEEWKKFLLEFGIKTRFIKSKKSKQGVAGIRTYVFESIYKFYKLGGFVDKVKISRKSKRYCGMEKNQLLAHVINLGIQKGLLKELGQGYNGDGEDRTHALPVISRVP